MKNSIKVKTFKNDNCATVHMIPACINTNDFKNGMDMVFGIKSIDTDEFGIVLNPALLRSCYRLVAMGVLFDTKEHDPSDRNRNYFGHPPRFLPTPKFLSLFVGAKKRGFYYWAGTSVNQIGPMVNAHFNQWAEPEYFGHDLYKKYLALNA